MARETHPSVWVVVPAAGRGVRAGSGVPKQYRLLLGRPVIEHTLRTLATHPQVRGVAVVLAADDDRWPGWDMLEGKPVLAVTGGAERADSVLAGLNALPQDLEDDAFVLVHDAARPCVSHRDIDALLDAASPRGAVLAVPLADTLKRADDDNLVRDTVPRDGLWRALTPQMFQRAALMRALRDARDAGVVVTDESMAMERAGIAPVLVAGSADNLKITTPRDFALAEFLLRAADKDST
ncbi:2-C-methyl-D-erythritol 4-phosphate cytidylyltransferase [Xanthomonadaceae bacterium XH05]|nr:2-C-methyl-D-erythritol 4-phosphate cytidylyltransferase [Xanthomonadaceae bacterium XH05]